MSIITQSSITQSSITQSSVNQPGTRQSLTSLQSPSSAALPAAAWDDFVRAHPQAHLLQTSAWGQLKSKFGWHEGGVALLNEAQQIQAGSLLLYRRAAGLTLAYAPRGPLTDWHDHTLTAALLLEMQETASRAGASVLKIEPDLPDTPLNRALLHSYGLYPSPQTVQPRSTIVLDIHGDDDAILKAMKSKWRYNIRLAERKEVIVREATANDLPAINQLMQVTGERDGFSVHSREYYTTAYQLLVPRHAVYLLAEYAGQPLAAIVVCVAGETAYYLWGASSDRERNRMPNHALQWAGIQWAKARGATRYDFWGIPDALGMVAMGLRNGDGSGTPSDEIAVDVAAFPDGELWGVYRFKQGFGGEVVRTVGAWDLAIDPLGYRLYRGGLVARDRVATIKQRVKQQIQGYVADEQPSDIQVGEQAVQRQGGQPQAVRSASAWQQTLAKLPAPHVLQSWEWGQIKAQTGWQAERFVMEDGGVPRAAFQFLWRQPVPYLPLRIGYVPKGPTLDWSDLSLVDATLAQLEALARQRQCVLVKIDPDVREDSSAGRMVLHALQRRGWLYSNEQIQFKNTGYSLLSADGVALASADGADAVDGAAAVDTEPDKDEETLLAAMKSKWRYNIRLATKREITVRIGTVADLPSFYQLYAETGARDGFLVRPLDYYRTTWEGFLAAEADPANPAGGALLLAEHPAEREPVAGLFLFRYGARSWYFYGASSDRRRRDMPNHLLQWEAMRWSLHHGCTVYDWWGAPTAIDDAEDSMQGVWQFKQGFGAEFQPHIGAWDFPVSLPLYRLYQEALPRALALLRRLR